MLESLPRRIAELSLAGLIITHTNIPVLAYAQTEGESIPQPTPIVQPSPEPVQCIFPYVIPPLAATPYDRNDDYVRSYFTAFQTAEGNEAYLMQMLNPNTFSQLTATLQKTIIRHTNKTTGITMDTLFIPTMGSLIVRTTIASPNQLPETYEFEVATPMPDTCNLHTATYQGTGRIYQTWNGSPVKQSALITLP